MNFEQFDYVQLILHIQLSIKNLIYFHKDILIINMNKYQLMMMMEFQLLNLMLNKVDLIIILNYLQIKFQINYLINNVFDKKDFI